MTVDPSALSSLPPIDQAALPADVRRGTKAQKQTYEAALGFERMLVGELTKSMMSTSLTDSSNSSSSDSAPDATTTLYRQMLPDELADGVTQNGGLGLADQLYQSIEGRSK